MNEFGFSEFSVGSVIGRAWTVLWQKPLAFFGITLLSTILSAIVSVVIGALLLLLASFVPIIAVVIGGFAQGLSVLLISALFQGALVYAIFMLLLYGTASVGEAFQRSANRVVDVILATIIISFVFVLIIGVPTIVGALLSKASSGLGVFVIIIGVIIGIVFMVIFGIKWSVTAPACVIERTGPLESLNRSSELTEGYRGQIFGVFLLIGIVVIIFNSVAMYIASAIFGAGLLGRGFATLLTTIPFTYINILPAVIYYSLRIRKENLTPESLADIFD